MPAPMLAGGAAFGGVPGCDMAFAAGPVVLAPGQIPLAGARALTRGRMG